MLDLVHPCGGWRFRLKGVDFRLYICIYRSNSTLFLVQKNDDFAHFWKKGSILHLIFGGEGVNRQNGFKAGGINP